MSDVSAQNRSRKRNMDYFAGLDVSVKETSVCISTKWSWLKAASVGRDHAPHVG
jgi:hypothetical protein